MYRLLASTLFVLLINVCYSQHDSIKSVPSYGGGETGLIVDSNFTIGKQIGSTTEYYDDGTDDSVHFKKIISIGADSGDYQVYYSSDSLYILYKLGVNKEYVYYCKEYSLPLDGDFTYKDEPDTTMIYYKPAQFRKKIAQVSSNSKKPIKINNGNLSDSVLVATHLKHRRIIQMANIDTDNLFVLTQDSNNFQGYLIWYSRAFKSMKEIKVTSEAPAEKLVMLFAHFSNKGTLNIIINQSYPGESKFGNCFSDFYKVEW